MNKTTAILTIVLIGFGVQSAYACTEGNVQHWTNVPAQPHSTIEISHDTEPSFKGQFLLPIPTMDSKIISRDNVPQIMADKLNELGYFVDDEGDIRPVSPDDLSVVGDFADGLGYSTICINGFDEMIGGMPLGTDNVSLLLAYGTMSAPYIALGMVGVGAGAYYLKTRKHS